MLADVVDGGADRGGEFPGHRTGQQHRRTGGRDGDPLVRVRCEELPQVEFGGGGAGRGQRGAAHQGAQGAFLLAGQPAELAQAARAGRVGRVGPVALALDQGEHLEHAVVDVPGEPFAFPGGGLDL